MQKIMFDTKYGLEQAVLEGRKTMTRRLIGDKVLDEYYEYHDLASSLPVSTMSDSDFFLQYAKYHVGEIVAIAQSYKDAGYPIDTIQTGKCARRGNHPDIPWDKTYIGQLGDWYIDQLAGWNNKMFVHPDMMPFKIKITDIKVERLQDISDEDCMREGIMEGEFMNTWDTFYFDTYGDVPNHITFRNPRLAFSTLIDKISGKGTWDKNPYVFVYSFELVK